MVCETELTGETERVFEVDKGLGLEEGKGVEGGWEETDMRAKRLEGVDGFDAQTELEGDARREVLEGPNESVGDTEVVMLRLKSPFKSVSTRTTLFSW